MSFDHRPSLLPPSLLLGAGLGGFLDGILFHQLLQWHNMVSGWIPVNDLVSSKVNMFWDGVFHAAVWLMTGAGLALLWRATGFGRKTGDGRRLVGGLLLGWGLFNTIEGTVDHLVLGIHHVREYVVDPAPWDWGFLASGLVLLFAGGLLLRAGKKENERDSRAGAPG
jgi:uncharacterized membrane protein